MRYALFFVILVMGYLVIQHVQVSHPMAVASVENIVLDPLQRAVEPIQRMVKEVVLPGMMKRRPNPYGYGGLDPQGGERKGGDGQGIPHAVEVGWWKGEQVVYPERRLSPVQDGQEGRSQTMVAEVGWWGDDWLVA